MWRLLDAGSLILRVTIRSRGVIPQSIPLLAGWRRYAVYADPILIVHAPRQDENSITADANDSRLPR